MRPFHEEMTASLLEEVVQRRVLHRAAPSSTPINHHTVLSRQGKVRNRIVAHALKTPSETTAADIQTVKGHPATTERVTSTPEEPKTAPTGRATEVRSTSSTIALSSGNLPKAFPGRIVGGVRIEADSEGDGEGGRRGHGERQDASACAEGEVPTVEEAAANAVRGREAECRRIALAMIEQVRVSRGCVLGSTRAVIYRTGVVETLSMPRRVCLYRTPRELD